MAEDTYGQFKEDPNGPSRRFVTRRAFRVTASERFGLRTGVARAAAIMSPPPYDVWKASLAEAVKDIKVEIREQHRQTRQEIRSSRNDILAAIKASPAECVKLICEFGSLFLVFSLVVRFISGIELINTAFSVFMLFSFGVYWIMALVNQRSRKNKEQQQR